ncbi:MAG: hypothetical protein ACRDTH_21285 [Pseudonocardiaceae bacterium]
MSLPAEQMETSDLKDINRALGILRGAIRSASGDRELKWINIAPGINTNRGRIFVFFDKGSMEDVYRYRIIKQLQSAAHTIMRTTGVDLIVEEAPF